MKLLNERETLYQWDTNQRLLVENPLITEVHFSSVATISALVCEVYEDQGQRVVNIPNQMLQHSWLIRVYGCCGECVREENSFQVIARDKPNDYAYTETEVKNYDALEERIKYLEENGIVVDLTGYATEDYVNAAIGAIDFPETDLSDYYTKAETNSAIDNKIKAIPPTDLTNYYTKAETNSAISKAQPDLSPYAKKTDIPSLNGYATESYVDNAVSAIEIPEAINGKDGGYYVPSVNGEGVLSWTASAANMPNISNANIKGSTGEAGKDGYTPIKGVDYWTENDKETIIQEVIDALGTPVFGRVDADNNIILTGNLADGTYIIKYEDSENGLIDIGALDLGVSPDVALNLKFGKIDKNTGTISGDGTDLTYLYSDAVELMDGYDYYVTAKVGSAVAVNVCYWDANNGVMSAAYVTFDNMSQVSEDITEMIPKPDGAKHFRIRCYNYDYNWNGMNNDASKRHEYLERINTLILCERTKA